VSFTDAGARMLLHGLGILGELEAELRAELGPTRIARLKRGLEGVIDALEDGAQSVSESEAVGKSTKR
jgi:hypothetical protein